MEFLEILVGTIVAYVIGSIPTTVLISKLYFGIDIREHGSGAASHTNTQRILGWQTSLIARLIDIGKGFLAAQMAFVLHQYFHLFGNMGLDMLMMSFGLAAVFGHIFPIFAKFRGGKGVHPAIGVLLALNPVATLVCAGIGFLVFLISRYPNLGYVVASFSLPFFVLATRQQYGEEMLPMLIFSSILFLMLFITHFNNLKDILNGEEYRADYAGRKF